MLATEFTWAFMIGFRHLRIWLHHFGLDRSTKIQNGSRALACSSKERNIEDVEAGVVVGPLTPSSSSAGVSKNDRRWRETDWDDDGQ